MNWAMSEKGYSQRHACGLVGIAPKTFRHVSKRPDDAALRSRLKALADARRRFGYRRLHILLQREGVEVNHGRRGPWPLRSRANPEGAAPPPPGGAADGARSRRPKHLLAGLLRCGVCSGGYTQIGATRYGCASRKNRGTCGNALTIRRDVLEETVLGGLKDRLMAPDLVAEFVEEWRR